MNYFDFRNKTRHLPVIHSSHIPVLTRDMQQLRNQITGWQKRGLLLRLRKGMYMLNGNDRKITPSLDFLANTLYTPSYISLEYALGVHGLIPERVIDVTSVTTLKTNSFNNFMGTFVYRNIKSECFRGFVQTKDENNHFNFIALPEKALVDFFYLNRSLFGEKKPDIFQESFRLQNLSQLNAKRLREFAELFNSKKLTGIIEMLIKTLKNER